MPLPWNEQWVKNNRIFEARSLIVHFVFSPFREGASFLFLVFSWKGEINHGSYGVAFSLLSGEQNIFVAAKKADLLSVENGTFDDYDIDFSLALDVHQTDTANKKFFAQNGMGMSADFYYEMPYIFWKKPGTITFEVSDLGIMRWNSNSIHYSADSSYH